jgi:integrase
MIANNPFSGFDKFEELERTRFLTEDELVRFLRAVADAEKQSPHLKDIVLTAILTGLRKTAILRLHKNEINFNLGLITKFPGQTNRNKRAGVIPIPDDLVEILKSRIEQSKSGYLFENPHTGKPTDNIKKSFKKALEKAGIDDFRFHDLRHTFATYALVRSKDIRGVQEILGHKNIQTTQKYTHVLAREKVNIVNGVGELLAEVMRKKADKGEK